MTRCVPEAEHSIHVLPTTRQQTVFVHIGQVDFVAEHDQPATELNGRQNDAVGSAFVLAVVIERFEQQLGGGGGGEVEADDLNNGQLGD